jgi:hypothetical protein
MCIAGVPGEGPMGYTPWGFFLYEKEMTLSFKTLQHLAFFKNAATK